MPREAAPESTTQPSTLGRRVAHLFDPEAYEFASVHALPGRAFCGVWEHLGAAMVTHSFPDEAWDDTCQACLDWWRRYWGPS